MKSLKKNKNDIIPILLNFSHPLTENHLEQIEVLLKGNLSVSNLLRKLVNRPIKPNFFLRKIDVQFSEEQPTLSQLKEWIDSCGLSAEEWQEREILVCLPSLSTLAGLVLADLHGRMGHFPKVLRQETNKPYPVLEILDLNRVRAAAREKRFVES